MKFLGLRLSCVTLLVLGFAGALGVTLEDEGHGREVRGHTDNFAPGAKIVNMDADSRRKREIGDQGEIRLTRGSTTNFGSNPYIVNMDADSRRKREVGDEGEIRLARGSTTNFGSNPYIVNMDADSRRKRETGVEGEVRLTRGSTTNYGDNPKIVNMDADARKKRGTTNNYGHGGTEITLGLGKPEVLSPAPVVNGSAPAVSAAVAVSVHRDTRGETTNYGNNPKIVNMDNRRKKRGFTNNYGVGGTEITLGLGSGSREQASKLAGALGGPGSGGVLVPPGASYASNTPGNFILNV